jgi:hypothetical protein
MSTRRGPNCFQSTANPHHAKVVHRDLELAKPWIEVFWLPHYSPELDLIERVWKHIKGSRLANVPFASFEQFHAHVERTLSDFAARPDIAASHTLRHTATHAYKINRNRLGEGSHRGSWQ